MSEWIEISDEVYQRLEREYGKPRIIDLRGLLGQMDYRRFRSETRKVAARSPRLRGAPVLMDEHHMAAIQREAVRLYGMDPKTSIVGAKLFGHELLEP